jgi:hypothetical protein
MVPQLNQLAQDTYTNAVHAEAQASAAQAGASSAASSALTAASNTAIASDAAASAVEAFDSLDARYLGAKTADPTVDNDGNALITGALYFNSTSGVMRVRFGGTWETAYVPTQGYLTAADVGSIVQGYDADLTNWAQKAAPAGVAVGTTDSQTLTNKTIAFGSNTLSGVQASLVSGTNIKTLNGNSVLGSGNLALGDVTLTGTQTLTNKTLTSPVITQNVQVISTNTTAVRSRVYVMTASLTLTLPASPTAGDTVMFSNRSGTNTPVIARNGQNIMGLAEDMTLDNVNHFGVLVFSDSTRGWIFN